MLGTEEEQETPLSGSESESGSESMESVESYVDVVTASAREIFDGERQVKERHVAITIEDKKDLLMALLNYRNGITGSPPYLETNPLFVEGVECLPLDFLKSSHNLDYFHSIGFKENATLLTKYSSVLNMALNPFSTNNLDVAIESGLVTLNTVLSHQQVRDKMLGTQPRHNPFLNPALQVYLRRVIMTKTEATRLINRLKVLHPQRMTKLEFMELEIATLNERLIAFTYVGVTAGEIIVRTNETIHHSARTYAGVVHTFQQHFLRCLVDENIDYVMHLYAVGNAQPVNMNTYRNERGIIEMAAHIEEGLTSSKFNLLPQVDFAEKFFITVFGFGSLNVAPGGSLRAVPTGGPIFDTITNCLGERMNEFITQKQVEGEVALPVGVAEIVFNESWFANYFTLLSSLPFDIVGPPLKPELKDVIRRQLIGFGYDLVGGDSVLSLLIGKDISNASFERCLSRWCFSAGDGAFFNHCIVDLVFRVTNQNYRRIDRTFPAMDVWNTCRARAVLPTIAHWIIPMLHSLRPLTVRTHSSVTYLLLSNLLVDVDRCIVGSSVLPRASLASNVPTENPFNRYQKYVIDYQDFENMLLFNADGTLCLSAEEIKTRRIEYLNESIGELDDIYDAQLDATVRKDLDAKFEFVARHVGIPKLIAFSVDSDHDCFILVGNLDPGFVKYRRQVENSVTNIVTITEAISTLVESVVKSLYRPGSGESRWSQLKRILDSLMNDDSYLLLAEALAIQKAAFLSVFANQTEAESSNSTNIATGINVTILGGKCSELRKRQMHDLKFRMDKMGYVGYRTVKKPIEDLSPAVRENLENVWEMPIFDFIFLNGYRGGKMAKGTRRAFGCLPFADVAGYNYDLMKNYATIAWSTKNPYNTPEDMVNLTSERIAELVAEGTGRMHTGRNQLWEDWRTKRGRTSSTRSGRGRGRGGASSAAVIAGGTSSAVVAGTSSSSIAASVASSTDVQMAASSSPAVVAGTSSSSIVAGTSSSTSSQSIGAAVFASSTVTQSNTGTRSSATVVADSTSPRRSTVAESNRVRRLSSLYANVRAISGSSARLASVRESRFPGVIPGVQYGMSLNEFMATRRDSDDEVSDTYSDSTEWEVESETESETD